MQKITLKAQERDVLGKKVRQLRKEDLIPAHVFGNKVETEHVTVKKQDFMKVYDQAGETGVVELRIGEEKMRPVMIKEVQVDPLKSDILHIDFYQVNLSVKVTVPVPVVLIGEEPELVHTGEAVVIQPISEVEVEALPTELPEKIEVDITPLKQIDDAITVSQLSVPEGATILAEAEAVVAKLDTAVTAEMEQLMEEQAAEAVANAEAAAAEQEGQEGAEGEEGGEENPEGGEAEEGSEGGGNDQGDSGTQGDSE